MQRVIYYLDPSFSLSQGNKLRAHRAEGWSRLCGICALDQVPNAGAPDEPGDNTEAVGPLGLQIQFSMFPGYLPTLPF